VALRAIRLIPDKGDPLKPNGVAMDSLVLPFISFRRGQDFHHFPKKAMLSREEKNQALLD